MGSFHSAWLLHHDEWSKSEEVCLIWPYGSINNKIAILTLGFLSLPGSVSARRGSTVIGQTAAAMICYLNFASSTPALCLWPLPDVNIFLLFELRDFWENRHQACFVLLWQSCDISSWAYLTWKGLVCPFFAWTAGIFELGCGMLNSQVWKTPPIWPAPSASHILSKKRKKGENMWNCRLHFDKPVCKW